MLILYASLLVLLNLVWLFLVILGLPGNWLMVLGTAGFAWWKWDDGVFGVPVLVSITLLATLGEVIEFLSGIWGSKRAGGTSWGAAGALLGGVVGALVGTFAIPIAVVGSLIGACAGAFLGALGFELLGGQTVGRSVSSGQGAAVGRLLGTIAKLAVGVAIWCIVAVAAFVP